MMQTIKPYKGEKPYIFISYDKKDFEIIEPILSFLSMAGYRFWYNEEDEKNETYYIERCCACLCFITHNYNNSDIAYCISMDIPVVSILLEPCAVSQIENTIQLKKYKMESDNVFYEKLFRIPILYGALKDSSIEQLKEEPTIEKKNGILPIVLLVVLIIFLFIGCIFLYKSVSSPSIDEIIENETIAPPSQSTDYERLDYLYQSLSDTQKQFYDDLYQAAKQDIKTLTSIPLTEEDWKNTVDAFYYDHPEFFWIQDAEGILYNDYSEIEFVYYLEGEELEQAKQQYNEIVSTIVDACADMNDLEKIKYVYDYVINETSYEEGSNMNQSSYSCLVLKKSVCAGYVKSIKVLLNELEIPSGSIILNSLNEDMGHALNMVKIQDDYYYLDATWGDHSNSKYPYIDYGYLLFDSTQLKQLYLDDKYTIAYSYEETVSNDYMLYYVYKLKEFDSNRIRYYIQKNLKEEKTYVQFYVEDMDDFIQVLNDGETLYSIFNDVGLYKSKFTYNVKGNVCTIFL